MATQRLPIPGSDNGTWGSILNGFLGVSHNSDGTLTNSAVATAGALLASNNLSELATNPTTARTNLGITPNNIGAASLASPSFTGIPTAPTAGPLTNNTQLATTAYANAAVAALGAVIFAEAPSGGDDTAYLQSICSGNNLVVLPPNSLYKIAKSGYSGTGGSAWPVFTGKLLGSGGSIIEFTYTSTYSGSNIPIQNWAYVSVENVQFTGVQGLTLFACFANCSHLIFRDCLIYDLVAIFSGPMTTAITYNNCRFVQTETTIAIASNGVNVSSWTGSGTLVVTATSSTPGSFPATGTVVVATSAGWAQATYTSASNGTIGGLTLTSGSGTLSTGGIVYPLFSTIQQSIIPATSGHTLIENCEFNYAFSGAAGAIIAASTVVPIAGASIIVDKSRFFTADRPGYHIDGAIDIEPEGSVPFDYVEITGTRVYNSSCYINGANHFTVDDSRFVYTSNGSGSPIPINGYNYNAAHSGAPANGVLYVTNCTFDWSGATSAITAQYVTYIQESWKTVLFKENHVLLSTAATATYLYKFAASIEYLTIDGEIIKGAGASAFLNEWIFLLNYIPVFSRFEHIHPEGTWQGLVVIPGSVLGGSPASLVVSNNDLDNCFWENATYANANGVVVPGFQWDHNIGKGRSVVNASFVTSPSNLMTPASSMGTPASGTAYGNAIGTALTITVSGGTVSAIAVGGVSLGITSGQVRVPIGISFTVTYSAAPTLSMIGD